MPVFIFCNSDCSWCTAPVPWCKTYRPGCTVPVYLLQRRSPRMYYANLRSSQHGSPRLYCATNIAQDVLCQSICCNADRPGCTMKIFGLRSMDRPRCTMLVSVAKKKKKKKYRSGCTMPVAVCICYKADRPGCTTAVLFVAGPVLRPQTPVLEGRGGRVQDRTNSSTGRVCSQYVSVSLHPLLCLISACALLNVFCERLRSLCNRVCCLFMTRWLSRVKCIPSSSSSS